MKTYQVLMTKVYEVRVRAESRDHVEELLHEFDEFADWYEFLKIHTLDIEEDDGFILEEDRNYV
jgi:hypothetical protein